MRVELHVDVTFSSMVNGRCFDLMAAWRRASLTRGLGKGDNRQTGGDYSLICYNYLPFAFQLSTLLTLDQAFACVCVCKYYSCISLQMCMFVCYCFVMINYRRVLHHWTICILLKPEPNIRRQFFLS